MDKTHKDDFTSGSYFFMGLCCGRAAAERSAEESQDSCRVATAAHHNNQSTLLLRCSAVRENIAKMQNYRSSFFSSDLTMDHSDFGKI